MKVSEFGELKIIKDLLKYYDGYEVSTLGPNEDAADFMLSEDLAIVVNVDTFVKTTDMPKETNFIDAGWKTAVMGISDLAAKGAKPLGGLLSVSLPREATWQVPEEVVMGFTQALKKYGVRYLGGDLNEACDLVLDGVIFGIGNPKKMLRRSGANVGDIVIATGDFGLTTIGLKHLYNEAYINDEMVYQRAMAVLKRPETPLEFGIAVAERGLASAAIDSSDGLAKSLHELAEASRVGMLLTEFPIAEGLEKVGEFLYRNPLEWVFYGGEEFQLIMTIPEKHIKEVRKLAKELQVKITEMGRVTADDDVYIIMDDTTIRLDPTGYEHFVN